MKKIMALLITLISIPVVSCDESVPGAKEKYNDPQAPNFTSVTVHDPSVFLSHDNEFYVTGSHLAAAKTTDLMQWHQVTSDWRGVPNIFYPQDNTDH